MDPASLAEEYKCGVCGFLPEEPYAADDGHFYHEACIQAIFQCAVDGVVISPATNKPMGKRLIYATTIKCVIEKLLATEEVDRKIISPNFQDTSAVVSDTKELAHRGSAEHMAQLGRWHLLGEQEGIDCNEKEGYLWCEKAAEKGNANGMAYQGMCLIHGYRVEKDRIDGFELLVDAANDGSAFASYKLGSYYLHGVHGFKEDRKRALKWLCKADDAKKQLSDVEKGNVDRYLKSILGGPRLSPLEPVPEARVPEHIGVVNNHSGDTTSQRNGNAPDSDSVSTITGTGSGSSKSGSSSLSSRSHSSDEIVASHPVSFHRSSTSLHSNKSPKKTSDGGAVTL